MSILNLIRDNFGGVVSGGKLVRAINGATVEIEAHPYRPATPKAEPIGWDARITVRLRAELVPAEVSATSTERWLVEQDGLTAARQAGIRAAGAAMAMGVELAIPAPPWALAEGKRRQGKRDTRTEQRKELDGRCIAAERAGALALGLTIQPTAAPVADEPPVSR